MSTPKKLLAVALLAMFLVPTAVFADEKAVDAGNKLCPISGEPVSEGSFVEYQGKRYGLCCPGCAKEFLKDPEKYLAVLAEKEKAFSEKKTGDETGHEGMHHM